MRDALSAKSACRSASGQLAVVHAGQSLTHFEPESRHIPVKRAPVFDRLVGKAMNFFRGEHSRLQMCQNGAPAFRSKIER